jgi:FdhE protein
VEEALAELDRLAEQRPDLAELAAELGGLLRALHAEPVVVPLPSLSAETAAEKLGAGVPLLREATLEIDNRAFARCWQRLVDVLRKRCPDTAPALGEAVRVGRLDGAGLTAAVLAGGAQRVHAQVEALGLDVPLTASVLALALLPILATVRAGLEPFLQGSGWERGYCPVCGSYPKLGEYRGLEQTRWLRCGLCAAEWMGLRLSCPFCANRDHQQLGYLFVDGEDKYRAATCEECRQYLKMVATLTALSGPQILVTDLATVHLDLAATDKGFSPPL